MVDWLTISTYYIPQIKIPGDFFFFVMLRTNFIQKCRRALLLQVFFPFFLFPPRLMYLYILYCPVRDTRTYKTNILQLLSFGSSFFSSTCSLLKMQAFPDERFARHHIEKLAFLTLSLLHRA